MTSRQRVITTLNHIEPDVLAIDFGAMRSTGISAVAYNKLKKYLGLSGGVTKLYDVFQQLAEPEFDILDRLGGDMVQLHRYAPAFGITIDKWKPGKLSDGSDCIVPEGYNPVKNKKGELEIVSDNRVIAIMPKDGLYFDQVYKPCENVQTIGDVDKLSFPEISDTELEFLGSEAKRLYETTDKAILGAFGGNILEAGLFDWGHERFFMALALEPDLVHYWFDKLTQSYLKNLKKYLSVVGKYIQIIQFGDDLGTQIAPQISPDMYKEMIKPYHKKQYQYVRENYPDVKVMLHSCGAIYDLIPDLIDAGVEVLNPVQISAKGMDPRRLKENFGKHITFWGGGADMQGFVEHSGVNAIKNHVSELIDILSPGGGFIFNQVHNIQADVPPEKVLAIYDTALSYRN